MNSQPRPPTQQKRTNFVKEGNKTKVSQSKVSPVSFFDDAKDWNLQVDLNNHVKIPKYILRTSLRPDLVVTTEKAKIQGMVELTVPY